MPPRFAYLDRALCLTPDLFVSVPGARRSSPLEIRRGFGEDVEMSASSPVTLGIDDLRWFVAVVALARAGHDVTGAAPDAGWRGLRRALGASGGAAEGPCRGLSCSAAELAEAAGYSTEGGGALRGALRASLARLAGLRVSFVEGGRRSSSRLLSWDPSGTGRAGVRVVLNARCTRFAKATPHYARVDLDEFRRLRGDAARRLHVRFSAWIDSGEEQSVKLDRLPSFVWGEGAAATSPEMARRRRMVVREALAGLRDVGWHVGEDRGELTVGRPAVAGERRGG